MEEDLLQVDEKSKYAKWRIAELKKLIESAGSVESLTGNSANIVYSANASSPTINSNNATHSPTTHIPTNTHIPTTTHVQTTTHIPNTTNTTNSLPSINQSPPSYNLPLQQPIHSPVTQNVSSPTLVFDPKIISEAEKQARFAISAMHFDDLPTAIQNLQRAIALLQPLCENK